MTRTTIPKKVTALVLALLTTACSHGKTTSADGRATIVRIIDGDTFVADIGGHEDHVRLIGIDTPETHKPGTPVECYGPEASAHLAELIPPGTRVRLERDRESRDVYGRLLAYVYRDSDGLFVELAMVSDGYAGPLAIAPNTTHRPEIQAAVDTARAAQRGLWGVCGGFHVPGGG
jgi:micrococcal nuclease